MTNCDFQDCKSEATHQIGVKGFLKNGVITQVVYCDKHTEYAVDKIPELTIAKMEIVDYQRV